LFIETSHDSREVIGVLICSLMSPQKTCETNLSREQKNAAVFANRISWRKITTTSLRSYRGKHNKSMSRKKVVTLNVIKKFCMQARNWPEIFWQT